MIKALQLKPNDTLRTKPKLIITQYQLKFGVKNIIKKNPGLYNGIDADAIILISSSVRRTGIYFNASCIFIYFQV